MEITSQKMNPEVKAKWVAALRSGEYPQTWYALHRVTPANTSGYCCLGVLCDVATNSGLLSLDRKIVGEVEYFDNEAYGLPDSVIRWAEIEEDIEDIFSHVLPGMNDKCKKFAEIADYIEANL